MSVGDVGTMVDLAARVDMHPVRLAGRTMGLSRSESEEGPGFWAACGASLLVGVAIGFVVCPYVIKR